MVADANVGGGPVQVRAQWHGAVPKAILTVLCSPIFMGRIALLPRQISALAAAVEFPSVAAKQKLRTWMTWSRA